MSLRYGSTFSGIGGMDRGLHRAGLDLAFACEWEPWRRDILRRHWPGLAIVDDVRLVAGDYLRQMEADGRAGDVRRQEPGGDEGDVPHALRGNEERLRADRLDNIHLLVGGFPCQDLSVAGRRRGFEGERSSLFFEFARAADDLVPAGGFVLIENVPGLFSSNDGRDFSVLRATLGALGFHDLAWRTLDSRHFGVPQRRRRVFILARRASGGVCAEVLLELSGRRRDTSQGRAARARAAAATGAGAAPAGGPAPGGAGEAVGGGGGADTDGGRGDRGRGGVDAPGVAATLSSAGNHASKPGRRQEDDHNIVAGTITNRYGASSGQDIDSGNRVVTGGGHEPVLGDEAGVYDTANAMRGTDAGTAPTLKSGGERDGERGGQSGIAGDTVPVVANTLKGQRGKGGGGIGPEETLLPQATVDEVGSLQASGNGYRNDADSAGGGQYAVTEGPDLGQDLAGSLGRMGETGGHRLDLDGHGAYVGFSAEQGGDVREQDVAPTIAGSGSSETRGEVRSGTHFTGVYQASREDPTALDTRMGHGPDDNRAQAGHLVVNEEASKALSKGKRNDASVETFVTEASGRDESPAITSRAAKGTPDSDVTDALVTHTLRAEGHDASEDGTGRGTPLVAGTLTSGQGPQRLDDQGAGGGHIVPGADDLTTFDAEFSNHGIHGTPNESGSLTRKLRKSVAIPQTFTKRHGAASAEDGETWAESEVTRTLSQNRQATDLAAARSLVRRLSPTECERLQGVPDGWTLPYGPSLADAPAWYEVGQPAPVNHRTFNSLPDQRRRDSGEMKGAVELRETDRSLTLDTSGRDPSAFNGGMMVVPEREEAGAVCGIGHGNFNRHADIGLVTGGEAKSVTENDEIVYESDEVGSLTSGGGKPGQGYPMVRQTYSVSGGGGDEADLRATETDAAETLSTRGAWAGTQGGTLVDQQADHLDSIEAEAREQTVTGLRQNLAGDLLESGDETTPLRSGATGANQPLAFKTDGDERSSVSAGDTAPTMRGAEAGTSAVALTAQAVASGHACPFDCPPDGPRYASLGDAVTSPVVQWQAERLVDVLRERGVIKPDGTVDLTADLDENLQPLFPIASA